MSTTSTSKENSTTQPNGIDVSQLPIQQLSQLQTRLSQELEHLSTSHARLRAAQARFRDCIRSIKDGVEGKTSETPLLIPLTTSLYVPAKPARTYQVLVDIGTGYYVSKPLGDARRYYEEKVKELSANLASIEKAVGVKNGDLRIIEDVLREKVLAEQQQQQQQVGAVPGGGKGQGQAQKG